MKWLSLHIFYYTNTSYLVSKLLPSFFNIVSERFGIKRYFYINYYECGPHVRVRLQCSIGQYEECYVFSREYITDFLKTYPAKYVGDPNDNWYPNNTIQLIEYEPELERYGGEYCVQIAENYFTYSSIIVLELLQSGHKNYIKTFINAAKLHISFAYVLLDFNREKVCLFFQYLSTFRYGNVSQVKYFSKYEDNIIVTLGRFRASLESNLITDKLFEKWMIYSGDVVRDLNSFYRGQTVDSWGNELWKMMVSYFHMTNNRLGINIFHEHCIYNFILIEMRKSDGERK